MKTPYEISVAVFALARRKFEDEKSNFQSARGIMVEEAKKAANGTEWTQCAKTNCGWVGPWKEQKQIEVEKGCTEGRCPVCGNNEFYRFPRKK